MREPRPPAAPSGRFAAPPGRWRFAARVALVAAGLAALPSAARAQAVRLPTSQQARPLLLPPVTVRLDGDFLWDVVGPGRRAADGTGGTASRQLGFLLLGFGVGVTDALELGASARRPGVLGGAVPLQVAPEVRYRAPSLYGLLRLLDGPVELAVRLDAWIPVDDDRFHAMLGVPIRVHLGTIVRVDTGVFLDTDFDVEGEGIVPLRISAMLGPEVWAFGETAVRFPGPAIPLEAGLGHTLAGAGGPLLDSRIGVRFPDTTEGLDAWQIWLRLSVFLTAHDPTRGSPPAGDQSAS